jgi:oligopeptide/dipeptide ABC transporter ATP-binding protein
VSAPLLHVEHLRVALPVEGEERTVLHDVSLSVGAGEAVGLVGESGSGKSMTARAVARLLPRGARTAGTIRFDGADVAGLGGRDLRRFRGEVATIFQDPRAHVNPVRRVGDFVCEALRAGGTSRAEATARATAALADVGIADGARRLNQYPHELSGGLLQRVMIAAMLLTEPRLVLADEPTTALDVTSQAEVMAILDELRRERGLALLFITHDLDLATAVCDRMAVMYAGSIVELQAAGTLHADPRHPYSAALVGARPSVEQRSERLAAIPGQPLSAFAAPDGCAFAPRCRYAEERCTAARPPLEETDGGLVRCVRAGELHARLTEEALRG